MKNNSFILKKKYFNGLYTLEKNACKGHFYNNSLYFLVVYELIEAKGLKYLKEHICLVFIPVKSALLFRWYALW